MTARIGPALIHQHVLFTGSPPDREQLTRIIDAMILTTGERRES
ncbi:Putative transcriptional regulatory protein [Mycobacterium tuberculosis]|nr:Putative transcriptional regulatory protein [Mycobacterium tuberculosis]CNX12440.1 Putative transcriptional regulatory protein [Mycobacterium tuberculosis]COX58501.1 Putative transcriptional regulatory protein [Mycobacterium tuberculosis]